MSQLRETTFNASSPHSSTGNAESYRNEGTPDTRLTVFSTNEGSARSSKYYGSLALTTSSDPQPPGLTGKPLSNFRASLTQADKDPFITSHASVKHDRRLSPLASDFQPFSIAFGSRAQPGLGSTSIDDTFTANEHNALLPSNSTVASAAEGEFTRHLIFASSSNQVVTAAAVNALLSVSSHFASRLRILYAC
jgi:hypothetical protein